ncbi:MAG: hypothetical protein KJO07_11385 [Deltaproteobacteria bacterium]|nr:hypothetical protein [Deltaproteobacteria bacterium]
MKALGLPDRRNSATWIWAVVSLPAVALALVLIYTTFARIGFPYDLEWMEGGILTHASRLADGQGIYVEPSVEFIPFLYTPLYPGLLAATGELFGISYQLGRLISIMSMIGTMALMLSAVGRATTDPKWKPAAWCGATAAVGIYAATYPWVEGWYDIVRADSLFLVMAMGGLVLVRAVARSGTGANGQLQVAVAAALLAFSFFAKQTGIFFVAMGGAMLLVYNWRRVPIYVLSAGVIGLGGTWLLNRATGDWFWTYIFEIHQSHDFHPPRFWDSFGHIFGQFPVMTAAIALGLVSTTVTTIKDRKLPPFGEPLYCWSFIFLGSTVLGAVGFGTQYAHFNAYIPAMATGAVAAGLAIPALVASLSTWDRGPTPLGMPYSVVAGYVLAGAFAWQLIANFWSPSTFVPTDDDRKAGDELIKSIAELDGDVFVPFHPWYATLAGKRPFAHRMGLVDMQTGKKPIRVIGVREAFRNHFFSAVILDNRPQVGEFPGLRGNYRIDDLLGNDRAPRVYTGAGAPYAGPKLVPRSIWVPIRPLEPPEDVRVIDNFESGRFDQWALKGQAWGRAPRSRPLPKQAPVSRYGGRFYVSSFHGGDKATGTLTSKEFEITGNLITLRVSGGNDMARLRAELLVEGEVISEATGLQSERMREVVWSVAPWIGKRGRIRLSDRSTESWGHLNVDEIWLHELQEKQRDSDVIAPTTTSDELDGGLPDAKAE